MAAESWSTWYNQPTAQIYHVAADNRFPYWLYGAQQDSRRRRRQHVVARRRAFVPQLGADLSRPARAIPFCPIRRTAIFLYGSGNGKLRSESEYRAAGQRCAAEEDPDDLNRKTWTLPQVFSLADEALYYSNQFVMRSRDRGEDVGENQSRI